MHRPDLSDPAQRTLGSVLRHQAERIPDELFVQAGQGRYSYGRVDELANAWAAGLRDLGVGQGDTVAFFLRSGPEFVFATFGAMKLGAIWVPTNVDYKGEWLRGSLADSRARVLVVDADLIPRVAEAAGDLPLAHAVVRGDGEVGALGCPVTPVAEIEDRKAAEPEALEIGPGDTAAVLWTSGT
ncbi:MAG: AMP-binding protein, partial [Myxococcota bacterium]